MLPHLTQSFPLEHCPEYPTDCTGLPMFSDKTVHPLWFVQNSAAHIIIKTRERAHYHYIITCLCLHWHITANSETQQQNHTHNTKLKNTITQSQTWSLKIMVSVFIALAAGKFMCCSLHDQANSLAIVHRLLISSFSFLFLWDMGKTYKGTVTHVMIPRDSLCFC